MTEKAVLMTEAPPSYPSVTGVMIQQPGTVTVGSSIRPPNYMALAFCTLLCCCCWPAFIFALVGFIFSVQVDSQYTNKDFLGAKRASYLARNWSVAAIVSGILTIIIFIAYKVLCYYTDSGEDGDGDGDGDIHED